MYCILVPKERRVKKKSRLQHNLLKPEKTFCKKMGCRKDKLMAQQIQETSLHDMKRRGKLSWIVTVLMLYNHL